MTARSLFPDSSLTVDQWRHVEELSRTLKPAQARWISGYFAGLDAGLVQVTGTAVPIVLEMTAAGSRTFTILFGSETGNGAELARVLAGLSQERGRTAELVDMGSYKLRRLKDEQDVVLIVSTHGEGDPPQPALGFFEYVEGRKAPRLEGVRFAVLALGDSSYEKYCEAGKRLDRRFEELGAARIHDRVDCDIDYEDPPATWSAALLDRLVDTGALVAATAAPAAAAFLAEPVHTKRNPFPATVLDSLIIVGRNSSKETRHVELDIAGSGLVYEPGDAIGVAARNDPEVVAALLDAAELAGDAAVTLKNGRTVALNEALEDIYEIMIVVPRFLEHWATLSDASALKAFLREDLAAERTAFMRAHHLIDIVRAFPVEGLDAAGFVAGLRPLQPRLYSIASSLAVAPDEAHITVAPVRYELHGERRTGVASGNLADRAEPGAALPVYVQSNPHFRLPRDDAPIIMIGAGTGVAPYRAFLQEREAAGAPGRAWLFFGERNFRSDFLYQTEWQTWLNEGVLSRMDVAFSRDRGGRTYVQHRMAEQSRDLFAWLEGGAHLYVCGDAERMAPDVHEALLGIIATESGTGREAAENYVRRLRQDGRYQRDVY